MGLGNEPGEIPLHFGPFPQRMVKIETLDRLIDTFSNVALIKMDVEGMEGAVLEGAREVIKKFKPIIYTEAIQNEISLNVHDYELTALLADLEYYPTGRVFGYTPLVEFFPKKLNPSLSGRLFREEIDLSRYQFKRKNGTVVSASSQNLVYTVNAPEQKSVLQSVNDKKEEISVSVRTGGEYFLEAEAAVVEGDASVFVDVTMLRGKEVASHARQYISRRCFLKLDTSGGVDSMFIRLGSAKSGKVVFSKLCLTSVF